MRAGALARVTRPPSSRARARRCAAAGRDDLRPELLGRRAVDRLGREPARRDAPLGIAHTQALPYLYFLIAWPWAHLFGSGEAALRSLSVLFGTAAIPIAWSWCRGRVGLATAAVVALNPFLGLVRPGGAALRPARPARRPERARRCCAGGSGGGPSPPA